MVRRFTCTPKPGSSFSDTSGSVSSSIFNLGWEQRWGCSLPHVPPPHCQDLDHQWPERPGVPQSHLKPMEPTVDSGASYSPSLSLSVLISKVGQHWYLRHREAVKRSEMMPAPTPNATPASQLEAQSKNFLPTLSMASPWLGFCPGRCCCLHGFSPLSHTQPRLLWQHAHCSLLSG